MSGRQLTTEELLDLYEKYHPVDEICAMSVIMYEKERCQALLKVVQDDMLKDELEFRLETLTN